MRLLPRSLNMQVILLVSVILFVTGMMSGWVTAKRQSDRLITSMREHSSVMVRNFAENCARSLVLQDYAELESFLLRSAELPDISRLQVCEPDGRILANISRRNGNKPISELDVVRVTPPATIDPSVAVEGEQLVIWQPIKAGSLLGWIKVNYSMAPIRQMQAETWRQSLQLAMVWVVGSALLLLVLLRPPLRAFGRLTAFAKQLDEHKGTQIAVNQRTREMAELAESLNHASAKLLSTEQQLIADREQLRLLKNYLSNIIDSMPSLLVGMDRDEQVTQWSHQAESFTGISAAEAVGKPIMELLPDYAPWIVAMRDEIRQRRPASLEKLLIEKTGERHFYDLMLYPLVTNGVEGTVIRIEDVTERTRIQELMIQTEKMMSVGGLAAGMAHEINNPLGIITQAAQNIERRVSPDLPANQAAAAEAGVNMAGLTAYFEQRRIYQFIASIREAAARASRIITNILRFSRRTEMAMQPAPLADLVEQALELAANDYDLKKKYDFRSIEIIRDYQPDMPEVPVVATEIEQVLLNLLKNAAQAMGANLPEHKPCITLRIRRQERYAVIEVVDNGPGMTEEIRRRVFEPFFTTKEPGIGTGLGLSVSYMIITQNHKGVMEVASQPGNGTRFTVKVPLEGKSNEQ